MKVIFKLTTDLGALKKQIDNLLSIFQLFELSCLEEATFPEQRLGKSVES